MRFKDYIKPIEEVYRLLYNNPCMIKNYQQHKDYHELQRMIIRKNPENLTYIPDPFDDVVVFAVIREPEILNINYCSCYRRSYSRCRLDMTNLSKELQEKILEASPMLVDKIQNLDPELREKYKSTLMGKDAGFF